MRKHPRLQWSLFQAIAKVGIVKELRINIETVVLTLNLIVEDCKTEIVSEHTLVLHRCHSTCNGDVS